MKRKRQATLVAALMTVLLACSPAPTPAPESAPDAEPAPMAMAEGVNLEGTEWIADSIDGTPVAAGVQSTISFQEEGKVGGSAGCNNYFGSWAVEGDAIAFGHLGSTKMMCPPPQIDQEDRFFAALDQAERFEVRDGALLIYSTGKAEPIQLVPFEPADE